MANDLQQTLERLNRKSLNLIERYQSVLQAKQAAEKRIIELETTIDIMRNRIETLERQVEYLSVVTTAFPSREEVKRSQARISELVREIDKCISDLSE